MANENRQARVSLADRAYDALREQITTCEIEPGAWVSESQLAVLLGVGKTPTREALRRLSGEGFVNPAHRRGYQVTPITVAHVREVFEACGVFVPEVAVLVAARATPEEARELALVSRQWADAGERGAPGPTPLRPFIALCKNPTLIEMGNRVVWHFERMINFAIFHGALVAPKLTLSFRTALKAIEDGNASAVRSSARAQIDATRDIVIAALLSAPSVVLTPIEMRREAS